MPTAAALNKVFIYNPPKTTTSHPHNLDKKMRVPIGGFNIRNVL
jgi:hypothetical protein